MMKIQQDKDLKLSLLDHCILITRIFCVSAGHGIGFNDQKTVEIRDLVNGLASPEGVLYPDFEEGYKVSRVLDAIALSYHQKRWVNVEEIA